MKIHELFESEKQTLPKVLFISFSKYRTLLSKKLNCSFCKFADFDVDSKGKISISGKDLISSFDFIFIGTVGKNKDIAKDLINYINGKIPYILYGEAMGNKSNKEYQYHLFKKLNIQTPKTILVKNKEDTTASKLVKELGLPIVSKITDGSKGKGINKFNTEKELETFLLSGYTPEDENKSLLFQEYIDNDGDFRLFFFNHELLFAIKRSSADKNKEFRNNISLGGSQKFVNVPKKLLKFASSIDAKFDMDFSGIDLIEKDDIWYVLEVNAAPQFINKEKIVIPKIIDYIKHQVKKRK